MLSWECPVSWQMTVPCYTCYIMGPFDPQDCRILSFLRQIRRYSRLYRFFYSTWHARNPVSWLANQNDIVWLKKFWRVTSRDGHVTLNDVIYGPVPVCLPCLTGDYHRWRCLRRLAPRSDGIAMTVVIAETSKTYLTFPGTENRSRKAIHLYNLYNFSRFLRQNRGSHSI